VVPQSMAMTSSVAPGRNEFLDWLTERDLRMFEPCLELVLLETGEVLEWAGTAPAHIVFPTSGAISLETRSGRHGMQVALIGNRGASGALPALWGGDSTHDAVVQFSGQAWRIRTDRFVARLAGRGDMHRWIARFATDLTTEISLNALASARGTVSERLARWLLSATEILETDTINASHDVMAGALGVRRSGVTVALHTLEEMQAVRARRSYIQIIHRGKLRAGAGGFS
jgi:CRP-like cAMP-binding protein